MKRNVFDAINYYIRNSEASLVNLLSAIAPWGAPLAPASMAYAGMVNHLGITRPIALILAAVIEILGLATVHTTLSFWQYNRRRVAGWKRQPTELAAGMFGFYLLIILTVNVVLEIPGAFPGIPAWTAAAIPILAKALLSLLAVPAAVTMAVRALHTETIQATTTQPVAQPRQPQATKGNREVILELHHAQPDATHAQLAQIIGVSRQYVDKVVRQNGRAKV